MAHFNFKASLRAGRLNNTAFGRLRVSLPTITQSLLVLALTGTLPLQAAESLLEEIVVTAQKREQNTQDVGIAISTFSGAQMERLGVEESFDIAAYTPGVHISGNLAGQNTQFTIRGVTQNDFNDIVEAPNAVYVDDGYLAIAQAQTFAVLDIERVEILKGPQGTLFGRNATGGLVHYITRKPSFERLEGYLNLTGGTFDSEADANQVTVEGAVGGPFSERVAGRLAARYNKQDGYLKNIYPFSAVGGSPGPGAGADMGDDDTFVVRGALAFRFSDELALDVSATSSHTDVATGPYQSIATIGVYDAAGELIQVQNVAPGETRAAIAADGSDFGADVDNNGAPDVTGRPPGADLFGYIDPDGDDFTTSSDFAFANSGSVDTWGMQSHLGWDINDSMELTWVSDYKDYEKLLFIDVDSAPANQSANYAGVDATSFTQELRINGETGRSNWVVGLYYLNIDSTSQNGLKFPIGSVVPGAPFDLGVDAKLETDSYSLFGQIQTDIWEKFSVTAGLRLIREDKDFDMSQNLYATQDSRKIHVGTPFFTIQSFNDSSSDTFWAGKLQLDWHPNDDLLVYAGINRGVKAGSFNAPIAGGLPVPQSVLPYDEEILVSYEGGFKATLFNGTTRFNGALFYYDYQDYQAFLFTGVSGVVVNADADNVGIELELQTSPMDGLDLLLSGAWFDATVKDVPLRTGSPLPPIDVDPTYAPEFQVTAMARYEWEAMAGRVSIQGDISYSDEYFYNLRNFDADKFDSYTMLNARLGWISADDRWEAALSVKNLTDERAGIQGFDLATLCGCNEVSYRAPRWYGVNLKYSF